MIKANVSGFTPQAANKWFRLFGADEGCIGQILQNQQTQATLGNFYVCNREPNAATSAILIAPSAQLMEDILPAQDELWVMTDTLGATLTYSRKYNGG